MNENLEQQSEYYEIIPEYNSAGRLCNYHTGGEGETAKVPAAEWERFNQLAGRQHEVVDGTVVYNAELVPCMPDDADIPMTPTALKLLEVSEACQSVIHAGTDVELPDGSVQHFSLKDEDQINLSFALSVIESGVPCFPYHADGEICRLYSAMEIMAISSIATTFKLYHTTYCNHLNVWIKRSSEDELDAIYYGVELPDDLAANLNGIMAALESV